MVSLMIQISDDLLERLKDIAQNEQKSVEELAASLIEQQITPEYDESRDPLLMIARAAEEAGLSSGQDDIAERSREILNTEFPDYLMRRLREQGNDAE
jgi:predicted transcriptional regulator